MPLPLVVQALLLVLVVARVGGECHTRDPDSQQLLSAMAHSSSGGRATLLHASSPVIVQQGGVFSAEEAHLLMEAAQARLHDQPIEEASPSQKGRSNGVVWLAHNSTPTVQAIVRRVAQLVGRPVSTAEKLQVAWYGPGDSYGEHYDAHDPLAAAMFGDFFAKPFTVSSGRQGGDGEGKRDTADNRIITALGYLRTVEAGSGGETYFPEIGVKVPPVQGTLLLWDNVEHFSSRLRIPDSKHIALPIVGERKEGPEVSLVEQNDKWVFNLWFRGGGKGEVCDDDDDDDDAVSGGGSVTREEF